MTATRPTPVAPLDYQRLATLLETAVSEQQHLASTAGDPTARYQAGVNAELFGAARRCAEDHARSPDDPTPAMTIPAGVALAGCRPTCAPRAAR